MRRCRGPFAVVRLLVVLSAAILASMGHASGDDDFAAFWMEFRGAVLAANQAKLKEMTALPFTVEDSLDATTRIDEADAVAALWPALLAQDVGLSAEPESMQHYVERHEAPADGDVDAGGDTARVGQFQFSRIDGHWKFTRAYLEQ